MNRLAENPEKLDKQQAYNKRNASSLFDSSNYKNPSKTVPDKPFNFGGKDIYVIDSTSDTDNADVRIVHDRPFDSRYEDRSSFLSKTKWPENVGPQFEMLNGIRDESSNSGTANTKPVRSSARTKSSNILDHFNSDSRNANREVSPHSKYLSPRRK